MPGSATSSSLVAVLRLTAAIDVLQTSSAASAMMNRFMDPPSMGAGANRRQEDVTANAQLAAISRST
jgi:hypothetical protein